MVCISHQIVHNKKNEHWGDWTEMNTEGIEPSTLCNLHYQDAKQVCYHCAKCH